MNSVNGTILRHCFRCKATLLVTDYLLYKKLEFGKSVLTCTPFSKTIEGLKKYGRPMSIREDLQSFLSRSKGLSLESLGSIQKSLGTAHSSKESLGNWMPACAMISQLPSVIWSLKQRFLVRSMFQRITKQTSAKDFPILSSTTVHGCWRIKILVSNQFSTDL